MLRIALHCVAAALLVGCATLLGLDEDRELGSIGGEAAGGGGDQGGGGGAQSYADVLMSDAPVAYYRFEESSGDFLNQVEGAPIAQLEANVAHLQLGKVDKAARFDEQGYASIGEHFPFLGVAPMSIELWVKADEPEPPDEIPFQYLVSKRIPNGPGAAGYSMSIEPDGLLRFSRVEGTHFPHAKSTITLGEFVHVVGTFDGVKSILYFDGEEVDRNNDASDAVLPAVTEPLLIGGGDTSVRLHGVLDELAIYDYAIDAERVRAHFEAAVPR